MRYLLLGALALATLVGCGGSDSQDDESRNTTTTHTRSAGDDFVRSVDALCKDAVPRLAAINAALVKARDATRAGRVSPRKTFETFADLLGRASTITEKFRTRLRTIEVPRHEREFYDAVTDSVAQGSANLRRQTSAARSGDSVELRDLSVQGSAISAKGKGLFVGHGGFRFCGQG